MSGDQAIDGTALARLRRLGGDRLAVRMIDLFAANSATRVAEALDAGERGDLPALERAVHSLKSSAGNVGARELQELAGRIEELAAAREARALELLTPLRAAHRHAMDRLTTERSGGDT